DRRAARVRRWTHRTQRARRPANCRALRLHPADSRDSSVDLPRDDGGMARMENVAAIVELFGAAGCPYTSELREHLQWNAVDFVEYDVDADAEARSRLKALMDGVSSVPVLVEDGKVSQIGWRGRSCALER